ncbi:hypothetical protein MAR_027207 [Mya arenaria]|uniref:Uncharacterized protein n=1 Tax=Mya arenaria TaxID=6604 RepID=A0ABY7EST0_MYAAR|nr:hypothetical protein MAR_027207 [Mya arenaria]
MAVQGSHGSVPKFNHKFHYGYPLHIHTKVDKGSKSSGGDCANDCLYGEDEENCVKSCKKIPPDGAGLALLQASCDVVMYDEEEGGQIAVSRERLLKDVVGANALILPYLVKVDAELLDAAGAQQVTYLFSYGVIIVF